MFCPNCGREIILENAKFCFQCGYRLPDLSGYQDEDDSWDELLEETDIEEWDDDIEMEEEEIETELLPEILFETNKDYEVIPLISYAGDDIPNQIPLFDMQRIKHYEAYIVDAEYVFPLGNYEIRFNKDCIVCSNIDSYLMGVRGTALLEFKNYYNNNVKNMEDWFSKACLKAAELVEWMQKKCENLLIASKIYGYSADVLGSQIDMSSFEYRFTAVFEHYAEVCENEEQVQLMRQLTKNHSSTRFVGGGFGFSGAMGGIMAAGVANAGVGLARGIKSGITAIGDGMRASANKRAVFKDPENYELLKDMICYEAECLRVLCKQIIDRETRHKHSTYNDINKAKMLLTHATEYTQNEEEFWNDIIQAIKSCPSYKKTYEVVYKQYYKNMTLMAQLKEIYKLFLLDDLDKEIDELYQNEIKEILEMPEGTSKEVEQKLQYLQEKATAYKLNQKKELKRLRAVLKELSQKEEEKRRYLAVLESYIPEAEAIEEIMRKRDFKALFEEIEKGSFIAEERYIHYYTRKIREEENVQLYNSIASNAGKHRAYLCIAGVCSYHGWGTEANIEIARQCILKSAEANCSYAKAFICETHLNSMPELVNKVEAEKYSKELTALASPTLLFYYGNALSSRVKKSSTKYNQSDYEKAIMYLEYAVKCHIPGAKQSLEKSVGKSK